MKPGLKETSKISKPSTLFHYTTATGLLGILGSSTLWASDVRFLNDSQEAIYAQDLVANAVRGIKNPVLDPGHFAHGMGQPAIEGFAQYQGFVLDALNSK